MERTLMPVQEEIEWDYKTPSRRKAEEIASEKIFGWQPFSAEQVESQREALGHILNKFQSNLTGGMGSLLKLLGIKPEHGQKGGIAQLLFPGISDIAQLLPTTEEREKDFQQRAQLDPEYEPGKFTERVGQGAGILGAAGSVPIPGISASRAALGAAIAPGVGAIAEASGAPKWAQEGLEMLSLVGTSMRGIPGINRLKNSLYNRATRAIPQNASMNVERLNNWAQQLYNRLARGGHDPNTAPVLTKLEEIYQGTQTGRVNPRQIQDWKRAVNSLRGDKDLKGARKYFDHINRRLNEHLRRYGRTNPQFGEAFNEAERLHEGLSRSRNFTSFLEKKIDVTNPLTWAVFGVDKTLGTLGIKKAAEVAHRIATNPAMRRYYSRVVQHALRNEAKGAQYYANKLDKEISKEFPEGEEEKWEYILPTKK